MFPPRIELGICPLCKGSGFKKESDFTRTDCICEETGNKYFYYELEADRAYFGPPLHSKVDYQDIPIFYNISNGLIIFLNFFYLFYCFTVVSKSFRLLTPVFLYVY